MVSHKEISIRKTISDQSPVEFLLVPPPHPGFNQSLAQFLSQTPRYRTTPTPPGSYQRPAKFLIVKHLIVEVGKLLTQLDSFLPLPNPYTPRFLPESSCVSHSPTSCCRTDWASSLHNSISFFPTPTTPASYQSPAEILVDKHHVALQAGKLFTQLNSFLPFPYTRGSYQSPAEFLSQTSCFLTGWQALYTTQYLSPHPLHPQVLIRVMLFLIVKHLFAVQDGKLFTQLNTFLPPVSPATPPGSYQSPAEFLIVKHLFAVQVGKLFTQLNTFFPLPHPIHFRVFPRVQLSFS